MTKTMSCEQVIKDDLGNEVSKSSLMLKIISFFVHWD